MATAGADIKVREMLGRMISSSSLTDTESSSLFGLNHLHPPLSSTSMEYLQKVISNREVFKNSGSYAGWQIMAPGPSIDQQTYRAKDQQQCSSYLTKRCLDDGKLRLSDPDTKAISRPGSPGSVSRHGPTEMGNSRSSGALDHQPQSSPPATGK